MLKSLFDITVAVGDVEDHGVTDVEARRQRFRLGDHQPVEGTAAPVRDALRRLLPHDPAQFLRIVSGLGHELLVLDLVFRSLHDHVADRVESGSAGTPGDLVELPSTQHTHPAAVELDQGGDQHRADGDVDPDPEGVRPTDDLEQTGTGELFDQPSVPGQHAGMVDPDAVAHQPAQRASEAGTEAEPAERFGDLTLLFASADVQAHQRLGTLQGTGLRRMDDVDRRAVLVQQYLDRLVDRGGHVLELQRHRSLPTSHCGCRPSGAPRQILGDPGGVPEGGGHEQELCIREFDQRHLPGPAAIPIAVVVELIHADQPDISIRTFPQSLVGKDLGGRADHGSLRVDRGIPGEHADPFRAEKVAEVEELLGDQCLDGCGVEGAAPLGKGEEHRADCDQTFSGTGGGRQDHVGAGGQFQKCIFLCRVQRPAVFSRPGRELFEQLLRLTVGREQRTQVTHGCRRRLTVARSPRRG